MEPKNIFRSRKLDICFYWKGIALGIVYDSSSDEIAILIPFFLFEIKVWDFRRRPKNKPQTF